MYFDAAREALTQLLSFNSHSYGKVLLVDSSSLNVLTNYLSFSTLLELGFLDIIQLDKLPAEHKFDNALNLLQVIIVVSNLSLVDQKVLSCEAAEAYNSKVIKNFDLIVLQNGGSRMIQRILRFDEAGQWKINRLLFSTINYISRPDNTFYCLGEPRRLPQDSADWSTEDFRYVYAAVQSVVNVCGNAMSYTSEDGLSVGQLNILIPSTGKTPEVIANLVKDAWSEKVNDLKKTSNNCCLVILDRSDDPIVPCLLPWTYLGMIREYLNYDSAGILNLADGTKANLSFKSDSFFRDNYNKNFGDLTRILAEPPPDIIANLQTSVRDLENAKKRVSEYKLHAKIIHEINDIVNREQLFSVWTIEQSILNATTLTRNSEIIDSVEKLTGNGLVSTSVLHRLIKLIKIKCRYILHEDYPDAPWIHWVPDPAEAPLIQAFHQNVAYKVAHRLGLMNSDYTPLTHRIISSLLKGQTPPKMIGSIANTIPKNIVVLMIGPVYVVEGPQKVCTTSQVGGLHPLLIN